MDKTIRTGKIRCGFVHIAQPRMNDLNKKMEYSLQLLIPKQSETARDIKDMIQQLLKERWGANVPDVWVNPLRDPEDPAENKKEEQYKDMYFMNVRTTEAPGIVGPDGLGIANPMEPRSGDYFRVSMGGFTYIKPKNGVSFGLNNVQFLEAGETLTGRKRAEDDFGPMQKTGGTGAFE